MKIFQIYRLSTYAKLFGAMGLTWLFEVIAWLIATYNGNVPEWFNFLVNSANILQVNLKHIFLSNDGDKLETKLLFPLTLV